MTSTQQAPLSTDPSDYPLAAWFLGPRAENAAVWQELIDYIFQDYIHWRRNYFPTDPVIVDRVRRRSASHEAWLDRLTTELDSILNELKQHFPFHSPRYVAHMLSEQTLPSVLGYLAGMLFNPNNVTAEAAPITVHLELEVGRMVAAMLGYNPKRAWAHISSGGTIANLEALWVARSVQFVPFMAREYCQRYNLPFHIHSADGNLLPINNLSPRELIAVRPNEAIFMWRRLAQWQHEERGTPVDEALSDINTHIAQSEFNPARQGLYAVLARIGLSPVIFVSAAAHYSVAKAANLLGYGSNAIRSVPVNARFQVNVGALRQMILGLQPDEYIAAVIGVVGTTEEGAVDPIHRLRFLRDECEHTLNRSFWLHVDAAWGGYIRSLFCGHALEELPPGSPLDAICDQYVRALKMDERLVMEVGVKHRVRKTLEVHWADREVYAAFLAMADADSTTVDPHKLGFVPYPAGIVAFRNGLVTELIAERAQYISDEEGGIKSIDQPAHIEAVGPYIVEGSKPGAAALGCWLAHTTIPLHVHGHGKIVRTTILSAKKLFKVLANHRHMFEEMHAEVTGESHCVLPFTFFPLFEPDTNIVCFVARPMVWVNGKLALNDVALPWINRLNEKVYAATSIPADDGREMMANAQPFFVSRTRFEECQYTHASIAPILERIGVRKEGYKRDGVFVLRSTVMNPWYGEAGQAGMDYLYEFVRHLHKVAYAATVDTERAMLAAAQSERSRLST